MDGLLDAYEIEHSADRAAIAQLAMRIVAQIADTHQGETGPPRREITTTLARAARTGDPALFQYLQAEFRQRRIAAERVIDVYIPAAVSLIGEAWHNDELTSLQATVAFARLQDLLRELGVACIADRAGRPDGPRLLMVIPEREQHIIGPLLATNRMRRMGVSVCIAFMAGPEEVRAHLADRAFDAVFVSVSNRSSLDICERIVRAIKRDHPSGLPVVVGGPLADDDAGLRARLGADLVTKDVDRALRAFSLIAQQQAAE